MNASEVHCIDIRSIKYQNLYKPLFCCFFFSPLTLWRSMMANLWLLNSESWRFSPNLKKKWKRSLIEYAFNNSFNFFPDIQSKRKNVWLTDIKNGLIICIAEKEQYQGKCNSFHSENSSVHFRGRHHLTTKTGIGSSRDGKTPTEEKVTR